MTEWRILVVTDKLRRRSCEHPLWRRPIQLFKDGSWAKEETLTGHRYLSTNRTLGSSHAAQRGLGYSASVEQRGTASNRPSRPRSHFDPGGGSGSYNDPIAVAVREDIHPDHFSADALAVRRTLCNVAALHHRDVAQYFHVHGSEFDGLDFDPAALDTRDELLFCELPAVVADLDPIVPHDPADPFAIAGLYGNGRRKRRRLMTTGDSSATRMEQYCCASTSGVRMTIRP